VASGPEPHLARLARAPLGAGGRKRGRRGETLCGGAFRASAPPSDMPQSAQMHGERDLKRLLASLEPVQRAGRFVFAVVDDQASLKDLAPEATVREDEGLAVVLRHEQADRLGIAYDYVAAWITLRVHSALDAVGLTAAISTALADAGLSCNVIAGYHHDHLLVPADGAPEAITVLSDLSRGTRRFS
jgi:uncharacterized protein